MMVETFLAKRFAALTCRDYRGVYASYHEEAPFLQQFDNADAYVRFADQQLGDVNIESWKCLRKRSSRKGQVECLLVMKLNVDSQPQLFYELALLIETAEGWKYHSAQKLSNEDFSGSPDQIDFHHFDRAPLKIRF